VAEPARPLIRRSDKTLPTLITELWDLVLSYLKQETLEPLKGLKNFVLWGIVGALLLSIGLPILAIALLRVLQFETGTHLTGNLSWLPYVITLVGVGLIAVIAVSRITAASRKRGAR
jgi:hypothetical protein